MRGKIFLMHSRISIRVGQSINLNKVKSRISGDQFFHTLNQAAKTVETAFDFVSNVCPCQKEAKTFLH